jgi:putative membrane protein
MWHMGDDWGWWMIFGSLMMAAFWIVVAWAVVALIRRPPDAPPRRPPDDEPNALEILERRYARGEVSDSEFERMRALLARRPVVTEPDRPPD